MANNFKVISLEKNHEPGDYIANIEFEGMTCNYRISSNAHIRYLDWIDQLSILNGFDEPFDGEMPKIKILGLSYEAMQRQSQLEGVIMAFVEEECCEKEQ
jgi:hypothetical protein